MGISQIKMGREEIMEFSNIQEDDKGGISNQSLNPNSALFAVPSYDEEDDDYF